MAALTDSNAGFSFENALRNRVLGQRNLHLPKATSTGTTIVGVVYESGIVLGADTRATEGPIVADKNCEKVRRRSSSPPPDYAVEVEVCKDWLADRVAPVRTDSLHL